MFGLGKSKESKEKNSSAEGNASAKPLPPSKSQRYVRVVHISRTKINYDYESKLIFAGALNFILSLAIAINVLLMVKNIVEKSPEAMLIVQARDAAWIMEELTQVGKPGLLSAEQLAKRENTIGYETEIGLAGILNYELDEDLHEKAALEEKERARNALRNSKITLIN